MRLAPAPASPPFFLWPGTLNPVTASQLTIMLRTALRRHGHPAWLRVTLHSTPGPPLPWGKGQPSLKSWTMGQRLQGGTHIPAPRRPIICPTPHRDSIGQWARRLKDSKRLFNPVILICLLHYHNRSRVLL